MHKRALYEGQGNLISLTQAFDWVSRNGDKLTLNRLFGFGGEGGIRTPVTLPGKLDFESSAFSRARPPLRFCLVPLILSQPLKKAAENCRAVRG